MLSGWCGQRGKPACKWCRSTLCSCRCHQSSASIPPIPSGNVLRDAPAGCVNTAARADRTTLAKKESG